MLTCIGNGMKQLNQLLHSLSLCIDSCLDDHVEELLIICLTSGYHLTQFRTEAIERNALFFTSALAVLCNLLRLIELLQ